MNVQLQNIIENFSLEELQVIKTLVKEIEKQKIIKSENSVSIKSFALEYFKYIDNNFSHPYLKSVKQSFKHLLNYYPDNKSLEDLSIKNAEDFKNHLMKRAPLGYKIYIRNLKAALNKAVDWEMISSNPYAKVKLSKHQQTTPKFLKLNELKDILKNVKSLVISELFLFAFFTGCRPGEIVQIRWGNIDLNRRIITIGGKKLTTKNKKTRVVPICNELLYLLKVRRKFNNSEDFVFSKGNGFPFNRDYISRYFKRAIRAAGLDEDLHLYSLRHSFASNLALRGVPIVTVKDLLGHSSIVTTQVYSHSDLESLQKAVSKFDEI